MTRDQIAACVKAVRAKHPEWPDEYFSGAKLAVLEGEIVRGADMERERIKSIDAILNGGMVPPVLHATVRMMQFDGKSTADDVALVVAPPARNEDPAVARDAAGILWDRVPAVREGHASREGFVAMKVAESQGRVRILSARGLHRFTRPEN
jgi:hypothetical protein